jgi:hypothetical protein
MHLNVSTVLVAQNLFVFSVLSAASHSGDKSATVACPDPHRNGLAVSV